MTIRLFEPIELRGLRLANRIIVAPMAQFSVPDGIAGDWHLMHLGQFAGSGAALVLTESTYVAPYARNAPSCLSIYSDVQEQAIGRVATFFDSVGRAAFGVHLCHAGRKASAREPWAGGGHLPIADGGYEAVAPSAVPLTEGFPAPRAMTTAEVGETVALYAEAAKRADRAGVAHLELHGAHGYLIHQFLSPITNRRTDQYGGSSANRMRFALEVFEAVRAAWPADKPIGMRLSATDWIQGGWTVEKTVTLSQRVESADIDYMHISSDGLVPEQRIETGPGYQVPFAAAVKARAGGLRVQELAHHRQQIIQRDQKRLAEGHGDSFLRWRQRRLKAMGRVAAILHAGTLVPFPYGLFRGPVTLGKNPRRVVTGLYGRPDLRWRHRLTVKLDHHVALPSRALVKTQRAMKNAERRGAIRSAGMEQLGRRTDGRPQMHRSPPRREAREPQWMPEGWSRAPKALQARCRPPCRSGFRG